MNPEILNVIVSVVGAAIVALLMGFTRYLFKKGGVDLKGSQWSMLQWALEDAVKFAEQKAFNSHKVDGNKMPSEEKMKLAIELFEKLADRNAYLKKYKTIAMPLIEAKVRDLFNDERVVV